MQISTIHLLFQLDKSVNLLEYGMVVAADAFAQMILSPLLGIVIDKLKSVRLVCMVLSLLFTGDDYDRVEFYNKDQKTKKNLGGNVFYAMLGAFPEGEVKIRMWMMLVARVIVGSGTTINSAARFYVTASTLLSERTTHIALFSLFQTLGFILGPGVSVEITIFPSARY